jgi:Na+/H+-dicarboxylate symporter
VSCGGLAGKLWFFYLITTSIAVALGLFFVLTIRPGYCDNRDEIRRNWQEQKAQLQT